MAERENSMPVWPGWETVRLIGRGSFGAVYEIRRDVFGDTEHCAMKHISIPQSENEILEMRSEGQNEESISRTFAEQARAILTEYKLMMRLNSCPNVVVCHDVNYNQKDGGLGWDIDIRMELLTTLMQRLSEQQTWPESEILRLGRDMARALCACRELSVLHRDVKPQNIFVAQDGRYKLGDFGIARTAQKSGSATMRTGTFAYMAPEVFNGKHYDETADQYSLGMVLYWLLNERRGPFVKENTPREKEAALYRRMGGEPVPPPANGSDTLKHIVLKCCAFDPEERFESPEELLKALENAESGVRNSEENPGRQKEELPETRERADRGVVPDEGAEEETVSKFGMTSGQTALRDEDATNSVFSYPTGSPAPERKEAPATKDTAPPDPKPVGQEEPKTEEKAVPAEQGSKAPTNTGKKKRLPILIGAAAAVLALVLLLPRGGQKPAAEVSATAAPAATEEPAAAATAAPTAEPTPAPTPEPTPEPTPAPTPEPTPEPTLEPTPEPTPEPTSGVEGNWSWSRENGVLTIRCNGNMTDYTTPGEQPWASQRNHITRVVIEDGITGIGSEAFSYIDSLSSVEIPDSVTTIGEWAFAGCDSLSRVDISESVVSIENAAFSGCKSLSTIDVAKGNPNYRSEDGVLFSKDGKTLLCCPGGKETAKYAIPDSVTTISEYAFSSCKGLTSVEIPSSVTSIEKGAFSGCGFTSVKIPESVTTIGEDAFMFCPYLSAFEVESGNPNYKSEEGVLFTKDGTTLMQYPQRSGRTEYTIPNGVTSINRYAMTFCLNLTSVEIPESVTWIGDSAFEYCYSLTDLYYGGTKAQWEALVGDTDLGLAERVTIHYGS